MAVQTFSSKNCQDKIAKMIRFLREPASRPELMEYMHLSRPTMASYIAHMRKHNLIHICDWSRESVGGQKPYLRPIYKAGGRKDKPKPRALTSTENSNNRYGRLKKYDPAKLEIILAKGRHYKRMKNFKPQADVSAQWLFDRNSYPAEPRENV